MTIIQLLSVAFYTTLISTAYSFQHILHFKSSIQYKNAVTAQKAKIINDNLSNESSRDRKSALIGSDIIPMDKQEQLISEVTTKVLQRVTDALKEMDSNFEDDLEILNSEDTKIMTNSDLRQTGLLNGVVRVYCTHSEPNFSMPWQRNKQEFSTSSGFIIEGNRILTNAHAVEYGSIIQVKKRKSEKKFLAKVIAVGHECDLAILEVDDEAFWIDVKPLVFGQLPDLQEDVSVIGFPIGGESVSISSGVVSRIEMQEYAQASSELLAIQIDAAINPGNSGGPVVNDQGEVVGVAFQSLGDEDTENIGYVVPVNVIQHFLDDVDQSGRYSGVCALGATLQGLENADLREFVQLDSIKIQLQKPLEELTGVLVTDLVSLAPASSVLRIGDVLLKIDGIKIANDGSIPFTEGNFRERVQLGYYFTMKFASDRVLAEVLRDGEIIELELPLWIPQRLIPRILIDKRNQPKRSMQHEILGGVPSYLIVGGLVMISLSVEYLEAEFQSNEGMMNHFESCANEFRILGMVNRHREEPDQEIVMLSQVLAHSCNVGYEMIRNFVLESFNGTKVKSLGHLKELLDDIGFGQEKVDHHHAVEYSKSLVFKFSGGHVVVLSREKAFQSQQQLCKEHFIPSICSVDLI